MACTWRVFLQCEWVRCPKGREMLLKIASLFMIAVTTHLQQAGQNKVQWVYENGSNKGYLCALMQKNGTAYDVYLPAIWPSPVAKTGKAATLAAVPWLHYANQIDALDAVTAYCPVTASK